MNTNKLNIILVTVALAALMAVNVCALWCDNAKEDDTTITSQDKVIVNSENHYIESNRLTRKINVAEGGGHEDIFINEIGIKSLLICGGGHEDQLPKFLTYIIN